MSEIWIHSTLTATLSSPTIQSHINMPQLLLPFIVFSAYCFTFSVSQPDESALLDFKNLVTNADTTVLGNNWTRSSHFCSWIGVSCGPRSQRVVSLTLPSSDLEGLISPSLANLSFLATLDLSNNSFHGSIPPDLFRGMNHLETLSLGYNELSGELWEEVWTTPWLKTLNLTGNSISGSLHRSIANATKLERLVLSGNRISGEISGGIGNMSNLIELDLSTNRFTGTIPPSIFNISSLRRLFLSNNSFSGSFLLVQDHGYLDMEVVDLSTNRLEGEIPSNLCRFTELRSLSLSNNNLTGQIPSNIGCLSRLEKLYMTENQIAGSIPPSLGNISTLQYLGCVRNNIGGRIPHELGKLSNLKMLGFDFNDLTGEIPQPIFNISSLVYIAFTDNDLSGTIPATTGLHLPNLEGIFLPDNRLEGEIPIFITNASKLMELELSYNFFVGTVPNKLGNLRELLFLNLGGNQLRGEPGKLELGFFDSLVECRMLEFVIVGNNPLHGVLPHSVQNLSSSIQMFNIENAEIYGQIPTGIGNMSSMITLVLNGNNLTGNVPKEIGFLTELQRIHLSKNMLQGPIPVELCSLENLGEIRLFENYLSGPIPSCIGNLGRLQTLSLSYNRLSSSLPVTLWDIEGLLFMNVSSNMIRGGLPLEIGMLRNLEGVDLSNNHLSSVIPTTLGQLQNLRFLFLSNNSFHGLIPASFGNLISLEILDLSLNALSGSIPTSFENLTHLREINVSHNLLEGAIPTGGVFSNSSPQSFVGNKNLCGMPSLQVQLCKTNATNPRSRYKKHVLKIVIPVVASLALVAISLSILILRGRERRGKPVDVELHAVAARRPIPYHEIVRATDGFSEANLVGAGGSGSVYKAILSDSTVVAVKVLNLNDEESRRRFDAECEILKRIRHRNLVKVITTCSNHTLRAIVLPYMPNGSLDNWLHTPHRFLNLLQRIEIMIDVAKAVDYLHHGYDEFPVVHCDLKPGNVLLDADMVAHVSDFGISKMLAGNRATAQTRTLGTIGYIAPEVGLEGRVSAAGDVYSYGIMLMEVVTRRRPTDEVIRSDEREIISLREWVEAAYPSSLMEVVDANLGQEFNGCIVKLVELALQCTEESPQRRISIADALIRLGKIKQKFLETKGT